MTKFPRRSDYRVVTYLTELERWPKSGRRILAQFDAETIVVYQAYRPSIGRFAAEHGFFGGEFRLTRMSWIKPNFLWMMYRSGWARKQGQEVILAIWLPRAAFDDLLRRAVHSSCKEEIYGSREAWREAVASSDVRLQFDPDHDPLGNPLKRRAIQLGLRGDALELYAKHWIIDICDITPFVHAQHALVEAERWSELMTPAEQVYPVQDEEVRRRLQLDD